jgi:methyl coenzyme M reductase alpha subunit
MELGNLLQQALTGIFTNGLWVGVAPDNQVAPFGVYTYFGPTNQFLEGRATDQNKTVQIDCYATTFGGAMTLADAVEAAMVIPRISHSPSEFTATQLSRQTAPQDPDSKLKRVIVEFSVWYRP